MTQMTHSHTVYLYQIYVRDLFLIYLAVKLIAKGLIEAEGVPETISRTFYMTQIDALTYRVPLPNLC